MSSRIRGTTRVTNDTPITTITIFVRYTKRGVGARRSPVKSFYYLKLVCRLN